MNISSRAGTTGKGIIFPSRKISKTPSPNNNNREKKEALTSHGVTRDFIRKISQFLKEIGLLFISYLAIVMFCRNHRTRLSG